MDYATQNAKKAVTLSKVIAARNTVDKNKAHKGCRCNTAFIDGRQICFFFIILTKNVSHNETHFVVWRKKAKNQGAGIMNPRALAVWLFVVSVM